MFSILLAVSLVLYLMFTVLQYGIVSVRKSNALSIKTSLDGVNGGGKFSEEQSKLYGFYIACYRAILDKIRPFIEPVKVRKEAADKMKQILSIAKFNQTHHRKAAENLCINSSAVVRQIKKLEFNLDCKLFLRNSRGLTLTN